MLNCLGGQSAKVCSSAKFGVVVFKACILNSEGGQSAKVVFVCQFWCAGMQGISALLPRGMGVEQPGELPRSALTTILHITAGKYEPS